MGETIGFFYSMYGRFFIVVFIVKSLDTNQTKIKGIARIDCWFG